MPEYTFQSNAGSAIQKYLLDQAARERQTQLDAQALAHQQEQERIVREQQAEQAKTNELMRAQTAANMKMQERKAVEEQLAQVGQGGAVTGDLAESAKKLAPFLIHATPGAVTQGPQTGEDAQGVPQYQVNQTPEQVTYQGTVAERTAKELGTKIAGAKTRKDAVQFAVEAGTPANQVDDLVNTLFKGAKTLLYRTKTGALAYDAEGKHLYTSQTLPEDYQIVNDPTAGANGPAPFFIPIQTAQGTVPFAGRTGEHFDPNANSGKGGFVTGAMSLRPSAAQQQDMSNNASALTQLELIKESFNPDWTGPLAGRYNSVLTAYTDSGDNVGLAKMQTRVASLKNRFIKAITGAQMSEPEAKRIMQELPDMNLPPTTFQARMAVVEENLNNLMELQRQVYTGERRPTGVAVTEAQLDKLYPDAVYTGRSASGGGKATPATGATPAGATPNKRKVYNPATGKVE